MSNKTLASFAEENLLPHASVQDFVTSEPADRFIASSSCPELYASFLSKRFSEAREVARAKHDEKIPLRDASVPRAPGLSMAWLDVRARAKAQPHMTRKLRSSMSNTLSPREQSYIDRVEAHMASSGLSASAACKALAINSGNYYGAKVKRDGRAGQTTRGRRGASLPRDSELIKVQSVDSTKPTYAKENKAKLSQSPSAESTQAVGSLVEEKSASRVKVIIVEGTREDVLAVLREALR